MAELNVAPNLDDQSEKNDISSMREKLTQHELDPESMTDREFAEYRLAVWAHVSKLPRVVETITRDLTDEEHTAEPSLERLRELIDDPRYKDLPIEDPFSKQFEGAAYMVDADEQKKAALKAVQRLHVVSYSAQVESGVEPHIDPHVKKLVIAILGANEKSKLRAVE